VHYVWRVCCNLFSLVLELDLLIYVESDGIGCSFSIPLFTSADLKADVFRCISCYVRFNKVVVFYEVYILFHFNIILKHNGMFSTKIINYLKIVTQ